MKYAKFAIVLVAIGILVKMAVGLPDLITYAKTQSSYFSFLNQIESQLNDRAGCEVALGGQIIFDRNPGNRDLDLRIINDKNENIIYSSAAAKFIGNEPKTKVQIKRIYLSQILKLEAKNEFSAKLTVGGQLESKIAKLFFGQTFLHPKEFHLKLKAEPVAKEKDVYRISQCELNQTNRSH